LASTSPAALQEQSEKRDPRKPVHATVASRRRAHASKDGKRRLQSPHYETGWISTPPAGSLSVGIVCRLEKSPRGWLVVTATYHERQLPASSNREAPAARNWDALSLPRRKRAICGWLQAISDSCVMLQNGRLTARLCLRRRRAHITTFFSTPMFVTRSQPPVRVKQVNRGCQIVVDNDGFVISGQQTRWEADAMAEMRPTFNSQPPTWNAASTYRVRPMPSLYCCFNQILRVRKACASGHLTASHPFCGATESGHLVWMVRHR
jgi:hypothetical protein